MNEKHSSGTSMWAWRTALGVVPTNAFEKDIKACAVELDDARELGRAETRRMIVEDCRRRGFYGAADIIEMLPLEPF